MIIINSNIQGRSLNVIKEFPYYKELLIKDRIGQNSLPLGASSVL